MSNRLNQYENFLATLNDQDKNHLLGTLLQFSNPLEALDKKKDLLEKLYESLTLDEATPDFFASISGTLHDIEYLREKLINQYISIAINSDIYKIRDIIHDNRFTWGNKGLLSFLFFYNIDDTQLAYSVSKDREAKVDKLFEEIMVEDPEYRNHDVECDCEFNNEAINSDQQVLHGSLNFLLKDKKSSFNAKGILIFMLLHRYKYINIEDFYEYVKDTYNSTEKGIAELVKLEYITEEEPGTYSVLSNFYRKTNMVFEDPEFTEIIKKANKEEEDIILVLKEEGFVFDENEMETLLGWLKVIPSHNQNTEFNWNEIQTLRGLVFNELAMSTDPLKRNTLNSSLEKLSELMVEIRGKMGEPQ